MLHHLAKRLDEHPVLVTFVGKSYDRHRIAARLAVHKIQAPVLTDRHLDLYHVIRRSFAKDWPDSRLRTAEERLLRLFRAEAAILLISFQSAQQQKETVARMLKPAGRQLLR